MSIYYGSVSLEITEPCHIIVLIRVETHHSTHTQILSASSFPHGRRIKKPFNDLAKLTSEKSTFMLEHLVRFG